MKLESSVSEMRGWLTQRKETAFRRLAMYAFERAGFGYSEAMKTALRSQRHYIKPEHRTHPVFMELSDSVRDLPNVAHLAIRGALADKDEEVVLAAQLVLRLRPELAESVADEG